MNKTGSEKSNGIMTTFTTLYGKKKEVSVEKIIDRPTVYGVVIHATSILLMKIKSTGKWFLPGGGVKKNEDLPTALRREIQEEAGVEVQVGEELLKKDHFFYYDPLDEAYHMHITVFRCLPVTTDLQDIDSDGETHRPTWVKIEELELHDFDEPLHDVILMVKKMI